MKKAFIWLHSAVLLCALALAVSAADAVVYVSDAGSDTAAGTSDAAPLKTLAAAYDTAGKGGTVVVCGPLTLSGNALHLPQSSGTVTITSVFGGVDYTKQGGAVLLEPVGELRVSIPTSYSGDIMGDISKRRGRIMGMSESGRKGFTVIEAEVPSAEMGSYAIQLRAMTQGRGSYSFAFVRYEEAPAEVAAKVIEAAKKEAAAE